MVEYPVHTRSVTCSSQVAATRPVGQAVKTPPFHGGNMGSIPVRVTMKKRASASAGARFFIMICVGIERPAPRSGVKNSPGDCFSGRGRFLRFPNAIRRIVGGSRTRTGHHAKKRTSFGRPLFSFPKMFKRPPPACAGGGLRVCQKSSCLPHSWGHPRVK